MYECRPGPRPLEALRPAATGVKRGLQRVLSRSGVPPEYDIAVGPRTKSEVPGYDAIAVTFSSEGKTSKPVTFLLSDDGKTLAQCLESRYQVQLGVRQCQRLFHQLDTRYRLPRPAVGKANPQRQAEHKKNSRRGRKTRP